MFLLEIISWIVESLKGTKLLSAYAFSAQSSIYLYMTVRNGWRYG